MTSTEPAASPAAAEPSARDKLPWFAVAGAALTADLWSKHLVFYPETLDPAIREGQVIGRVCSWWRTVIAYNTGATFGLGASAGPWILCTLVAIVIVMLVRSLLRTPLTDRVRCFALSIVIGGAVGNLYDRALRPLVEPDKRPGVRDFLDWYVPEDTALAKWLQAHGVHNHWYTFNVADALIVSGVVLLAWKILREPSGKPSDEKSSAPGTAA